MTAAAPRAVGFSPVAALRYWRRNAVVGRRTLFTTLAPRFVEAIAYLAVMGLGMGTYLTRVDGMSYVAFIAPGVCASTVMMGAIIETTYNAFVRIHVRRIVEAAITTPLSVPDVVVGEYLWATTRALAYGSIFMVVMVAGGLVASPWALATVPVMALGGLMFAVFGMLYTAYVRNIEHFNIFYTGVLTPMFLFGGIFFPFDRLPEWAQVLAWSLPLSHFVQAMRDLTRGDVGLSTVGNVAVMAAITAVLFALPLRRLDRMLRA